jgi:hypothetical protein
MEVPEGFSGIFIPRELVLDGEIPYSTKLLFGMIMCLDRHPGCCASDEYFGTILGTTDRSIRTGLKLLEDRRLIFRKTIDNRRYITTAFTAQFKGGRKLPGGAEENFHPALTIEIEKKDIDTPPNPQGGKGYDPMNVPLPYAEKFKEHWILWIKHRREIKKRMTELSSTMTLKTLELLLNEEHACQAIREAIEKGWQGVYPRTNQKPTKGPLGHKDHERF